MQGWSWRRFAVGAAVVGGWCTLIFLTGPKPPPGDLALAIVLLFALLGGIAVQES